MDFYWVIYFGSLQFVEKNIFFKIQQCKISKKKREKGSETSDDELKKIRKKTIGVSKYLFSCGKSMLTDSFDLLVR